MHKTTSSRIKSKVKKNRVRLGVQIFFFVFVFLTSLNHSLAESGRTLAFMPAASLHAICPFGGIVSLYQFFTVGTLVQKIHESAFVLMAAVFFLAVLAGPVLCGWICPLGSFQEWISQLGRKMTGKRFNTYIPIQVDRILRYLRYGVLIWVVYQTALSGKLIFQEVDPYYALFNFWSSEVAPVALVILGVTIFLSLFVERPWCKYACPYGALLGLFNKIRIFKIRRAQKTCINCGACDSACPMNITVSEHRTVRDHQCISCLECTSEFHCPVQSTVEFKIKEGGVL
jgi:polyferredoxin